MSKIKNLIKRIIPKKYLYKYKYSLIKKNKNKTYKEVESEINNKFHKVFGRDVNWDNPTTYNEKVNVSKLYGDNPLKTKLADKILVVDWVKEKVGENGCKFIPVVGVYNSVDEIDFAQLPKKYVMKMNNDSGSVLICDEKHPMTDEMILKYKHYYQRRNYAYQSYEMHYKDIKPKIIIEKYMGDAISDYKFQCFGGKAYYCAVDFDRFGDHTRNFYNKDWELLSFNKGGFENKINIKKPVNFEKMWKMAERLSLGFDQVRVDFYNIDGDIYFGEMTFTSGSGFSEFSLDTLDAKFGKLWNLDMEAIREKRSELLATGAKIGS